MTTTKPVPGTGGDHYIPYSERSGAESVVYFTRDLSAEGLLKIFKRISANLTGKTAIKLQLSCIPANRTGLTLFRARGLKT